MSTNPDRLYELLPAIYRIRDHERGEPLKALLSVINEQVDLVEEDIAGLYDSWFIETCEDWVVPYIADLVGYQQVHEAGEPGDIRTEQGRERNKILIPRREVANTIHYRRRKGTLALLELLANTVAGWPARAVEFYKLLAWTQSLNHLRMERGRTVDLRNNKALRTLDGPFDELAHSVDVRRINSSYRKGRYNIPSIGVFVWRLKPFSISRAPAYCVDSSAPPHFAFSILGSGTPLFHHPQPEEDPTHIAGEFNLPVPISRRLLDESKELLYGEDKSLCVWRGVVAGDDEEVIEQRVVPAEQIVVADLTDWHYVPQRHTVLVDPELGRIVFPSSVPAVWVSYYYGFSDALGGGEYARDLVQVKGAVIYSVKESSELDTLDKAINLWEEERPAHAVIQLEESRDYEIETRIKFAEGHQTLQIRAAVGKRPVIRILDHGVSQFDALTVVGVAGGNNRFTLDGILVTGRGILIRGDLEKLTIRHSTLVPGWAIDSDCEPEHGIEPSLLVNSPNVCIVIEHSIIGSIQIDPVVSEALSEDRDITDDERCLGIGPDYRLDPIRVCISDSIVDATGDDKEAIGAPGCPRAHAVLNVQRSTVIGRVQVHAVEEGNNSIFMGVMNVARRQLGCLRFSYVTLETAETSETSDTPELVSRTPRRYNCQPDLGETAIETELRRRATDSGQAQPPDEEIETAKQNERARIRPQFNSLFYGSPAYCQLADTCAEEIKRGADDESEMGVFHDLFQPQREANLRVRLDEYIPARADVDIIKVT